MQRQNIAVTVVGSDRTALAICGQALQEDEDIRIVGYQSGTSNVLVEALPVGTRILVLDTGVCNDAELSLLAKLRDKFPRTQIILLAHGDVDEDWLLIALARGVRGYMQYGAVDRHLAKAVRSVAQGEAWVSRKVLAKIMNRLLH